MELAEEIMRRREELLQVAFGGIDRFLESLQSGRHGLANGLERVLGRPDQPPDRVHRLRDRRQRALHVRPISSKGSRAISCLICSRAPRIAEVTCVIALASASATDVKLANPALSGSASAPTSTAQTALAMEET